MSSHRHAFPQHRVPAEHQRAAHDAAPFDKGTCGIPGGESLLFYLRYYFIKKFMDIE
jgi:hypothetical protein